MAEVKSFTKASEATGIQQAGLSKAIKKLEDSFKEKLFIRRPRSLELTEFGLHLQRQLYLQNQSWENGLQTMYADLEKIGGRLSVGAHSAVAINSLSALFCHLNEKYKHLSLELVLDRSNELVKKVVQCEVDIGLVINPVSYPDLVVKDIAKESVSLWSSAADYSPVLYFSPEMVDIVSTLRKFKKYKKVAISDYEVLAYTLKNSKGIGLLPDTVAKRFKPLEKVGNSIKTMSLSLVYRHDRIKTGTFSMVIDAIKKGKP